MFADFWVLMLIFSMLIPFTMILQGGLFLAKPPKEINWKYGYITKLSIKNREMWEFAQKHCGRLWCSWGLCLLLLTFFLMLLVKEKGKDFIEGVSGMLNLIQVVVYMMAQTPTDRALKLYFDGNGFRRQLQTNENSTKKEFRKSLCNRSLHDILCMK